MNKKDFKRYLFANQEKTVLRYKEGGETYYFAVSEFDGKNVSGTIILSKKGVNGMSLDNLLDKDKLRIADFKKFEDFDNE